MNEKVYKSGTLTNAAATSDPFPNAKEFATVYVWGTFDGATVKMQDQPADQEADATPITQWFDTDDITGTSTFRKNIRLAGGSILRMTMSGGGGSEAVKWMVVVS